MSRSTRYIFITLIIFISLLQRILTLHFIAELHSSHHRLSASIYAFTLTIFYVTTPRQLAQYFKKDFSFTFKIFCYCVLGPYFIFLYLSISYLTDSLVIPLHTANTTSSTRVFGHLGLRRGLIPMWLGHPLGAERGSEYLPICLCVPPGCFVRQWFDFLAAAFPHGLFTYATSFICLHWTHIMASSSLSSYHHHNPQIGRAHV